MHACPSIDSANACIQHEEALNKAEATLKEDALNFDAFLKDNDEKVQVAIRKADVETKAKQEKVCCALPAS